MKNTRTKTRTFPKEESRPRTLAWTELNVLWLVVIPIFTFLVYNSVTKFDMTNWDDKHYLKEQPIVKGVTETHLKSMFTNKVLASYNPVVLFTYALDYDFAHLKPGWCHGVNMLFHILNAILVYACMRKLRFRNSQAGMIALLFAAHPFASEAVAWIASRKDVVYAFFFFLSWLFYLRNKHKPSKIDYALSIFFFVFSLFSKVQAITLPMVLLVSDYMLSGELKWKNLKNKIPYFALSITFGLIALAGSSFAADKYSAPISFLDKIFYSAMAFGLYVGKIFFPFRQTAIYLFPDSGSQLYWILAGLGILLVALVAYLAFVRFKTAPRVTGGILFFAVNIFLVLHLVAVNSALIYERFVYVADIGIFMTFFGADKVNENWKSFRGYFVPLFILFCAFATMNRIQVWKNSETLWTDVISKSPKAADAYTNRGQYFAGIGNEDRALSDYNESIRLKPNKPDSYNNRSIIYFNKKDWIHSLDDNQHVLNIDSAHTDGLVNRGAIYFNMAQYDSAIYYYGKAIHFSPNHAKAYYDRGASYYKINRFDEAIADYKAAIRIIPEYADAYAYLSLAYLQLSDFENSELAILSSERYNANSGARQMCSNEMIHKGNTAYENKQEPEALKCYEKASEIWPQNAEAFYDLGGIYLMRKDLVKARECWKKTLEINPSHVEANNWMKKTGG